MRMSIQNHVLSRITKDFNSNTCFKAKATFTLHKWKQREDLPPQWATQNEIISWLAQKKEFKIA